MSDHEFAPLYPSLWAELAMLGLCCVFCMGLVLLAALIVGRV